ncbi:MAG: DmsE family decaheme c-type cytochrome [Ignavibacteria bacterium]
MKLLALLRWIAAVAVVVTPVLAGAEEANAPPEKEAPKDIVLKGDAKCTGCHDESDVPKPTMLELHPQVLTIGKSKHGTAADGRTPTCTDCHGESLKHRDYKGSAKPPKPDIWFTHGTQVPAEVRSERCLACHQGGARISWQSSVHSNRDLACTSCHQIHTGRDRVRDKALQTEVCFSCHKEQRAQMNRDSHHPVPEGKMACSSCHNVHGDNPKQLVKGSVNETCYSCHMEKRGPFVHNHEPVSEDCSICHQPHGTSIPNLLVRRPPMLCVGCHGPSSHPSQPPALLVGSATETFNTNARAGFGTEARGCLNCHTNIHGSNSPQNNVTTQRFRR